MKILILGSGGREHALALAYSRSKKTTHIFVGPGNGLTDFQTKKISNIPPIKINDIHSVLQAVKKHRIDLVDVANDEPLALGFVDQLTKAGITAFGPTQKAAQLEWSKEWSRNFMQKYKLPTPHFKSFTNTKDALQYIDKLPEQPLFVKASGLALGKGAIKAENRKQAIDAIQTMKQFGKAGETFLIEQCLVGEEFSLFAICDGNSYSIVASAQDHKTVFNANKGPNTGGVGCVSPISIINNNVRKTIESKIIKPLLLGMGQEGRPYTGILYLGGMLTNPPAGGEVQIVEFNARWGDPEAQVILPSIKTEYLTIVEKAMNGNLDSFAIKIDNLTRISVAGYAQGYPNDYSAIKGKEIFGLEKAMQLPGITIYGAGIQRQGKRFFVSGGRIFHLVAKGKDVAHARQKAYEAMSLIFIEGNNLHYRTDIGWQEMARLYI